MNTGGAIPVEVSDLLFRTAQDMARRGKAKVKIKNDHCMGVLSTRWKYSSMGSVSGVEFTAEVLVGGKESTISFIVQGNWLDIPEGAVWGRFKDLEAVERFAAQAAMHEKPSRLN